MARQVSTLQVIGRVGNLTGFTDSKGNIAIRKNPDSVKNPQTEKQVLQRTAFLQASNLAALFKDSIAGLQPYARQNRITARNAFTKLNLREQRILAIKEGNDIVGHAGNLRLSKGEDIKFDIVGSTDSATGSVVLTITGTTGYDIIHAVGYSLPQNKVVHVAVPAAQNGRTEAILKGFNDTGDGQFYVYAQRTATEADRWNYLDIYNKQLTGQALAQQRTIETNSLFTETQQYIYT